MAGLPPGRDALPPSNGPTSTASFGPVRNPVLRSQPARRLGAEAALAALDAQLLDDLRPARGFALDVGLELGGRGADDGEAQGVELFVHAGLVDDAADFLRQQVDHRARGVLRSEQAEPYFDVVVEQAEVGERGDVRE